MTTPTRPSLDDPSLTIPVEHAGIFEPIPVPRTERQREFYDLKDGELLLNMGPHHPSTHGVLRVVLKINGEQIVDIDPVLGYLHRGVEKLCENADYHQVISQVDPLEYVSALFNEWGAVLSFEKLLDVEVPRRAEYIRVLSAELNRVASHMLFLGFYALDLGGITPILWSFAERDEIMEMLAALTGQKLLFNYFRIGGVNGDLNHEFLSRLGDWMSRAGTHLEDGHRPSSTRTRSSSGAPAGSASSTGRWRPGCASPGRTSAPPASPSTSGGPTRTASIPSSTSTSRPGARATRWPATCCASTR